MVSAGRDANAAVRLENEFAIVPPTETRTAPLGGVVPLEGWTTVELADGVADGTGVVEVGVPLRPDAEKLNEGAKLYASMSIHEVLPKNVPRSYAAT